jgi:hypothetical protein
MSDEDRMKWELSSVREAISHAWANLATNKLTSDQRKALREHLEMNISALQDLITRNRLALQTARVRRLQSPRTH